MGPCTQCGRLRGSSWVLASAWPRLSYCDCLGNDPADGRSHSLCVSLTFKQVNPLKTKYSKREREGMNEIWRAEAVCRWLAPFPEHRSPAFSSILTSLRGWCLHLPSCTDREMQAPFSSLFAKHTSSHTIFYLLIHIPNAHNSQGEAGLKPRFLARN